MHTSSSPSNTWQGSKVGLPQQAVSGQQRHLHVACTPTPPFTHLHWAAPFAAAAPPSSSHSFYTVVPQPQPLGLPDESLYPYSVLPKRPSPTKARPPLQGPAVYLGSGTPDHGQYASADSESLSDSQSRSASQSLTGSTSQSGSESLRSASEYSSSMNGSSSVSFARSEDSSSISDGDSQDSTSGMGSDVELSPAMSFGSENASVSESINSKRRIHQTEEDADGGLGHNLNAFPQYVHAHNFLDQRTASLFADTKAPEVRDQPFFPFTYLSACWCMQKVLMIDDCIHA